MVEQRMTQRVIDNGMLDPEIVEHRPVGVTPARRHTCDTRPRPRATQRRRPAVATVPRPARAGRRLKRQRARVTRRGRVLLVLVVSALLMAAFSLGRVSTNAASAGPAKPAQVTVHAGETLWDVATRIAPKHDPRQIVAQLQRLNHLAGPQLVAGQVLLVPRG